MQDELVRYLVNELFQLHYFYQVAKSLGYLLLLCAAVGFFVQQMARFVNNTGSYLRF